jgi:hypothetical protein
VVERDQIAIGLTDLELDVDETVPVLEDAGQRMLNVSVRLKHPRRSIVHPQVFAELQAHERAGGVPRGSRVVLGL